MENKLVIRLPFSHPLPLINLEKKDLKPKEEKWTAQDYKTWKVSGIKTWKKKKLNEWRNIADIEVLIIDWSLTNWNALSITEKWVVSKSHFQLHEQFVRGSHMVYFWTLKGLPMVKILWAHIQWCQLNKTRFPNEKWGISSWLEPLCR